jgi:hypothetical protein
MHATAVRSPLAARISAISVSGPSRGFHPALSLIRNLIECAIVRKKHG